MEGLGEACRLLFHQDVVDAIDSASVSPRVEAVSRMNTGFEVESLTHDHQPATAAADGIGRTIVASEQSASGEADILLAFRWEMRLVDTAEPVLGWRFRGKSIT